MSDPRSTVTPRLLAAALGRTALAAPVVTALALPWIACAPMSYLGDSACHGFTVEEPLLEIRFTVLKEPLRYGVVYDVADIVLRGDPLLRTFAYCGTTPPAEVVRFVEEISEPLGRRLGKELATGLAATAPWAAPTARPDPRSRRAREARRDFRTAGGRGALFIAGLTDARSRSLDLGGRGSPEARFYDI